MSTAVADRPATARRTDFRGHELYVIAEREMYKEMASFPWTPLTAVQDAEEQDARAAGFSSPRQADAEQVAHATMLVGRISETGILDGGGPKVLLTLTSDLEAQPRSRGMLLALQAIVNAGLPAVISDRREPPNERHDCIRHAADLLIVYPRE